MTPIADARNPSAAAPVVTARGTPAWSAWMHEHWPEVHLEHTSVHETRGHERARLRVQACVALGVLLPADVRVELLPAESATAAGVGRQMFSVASLHNGRYRYEAEVPVAAERERMPPTWVVRVRPAAHPKHPPLPPVEKNVRRP